jgi:hypothetical protein
MLHVPPGSTFNFVSQALQRVAGTAAVAAAMLAVRPEMAELIGEAAASASHFARACIIDAAAPREEDSTANRTRKP